MEAPVDRDGSRPIASPEIRPEAAPAFRRTASARAAGQNAPQFTLRAVGAGLFVGTIINFSNMYFGLQTGWVSMMSMPASLIGFATFKALAQGLQFPFTPVENVLVQTVAVAVGSMPLSAGYVGVIPALEKLLKPEEGGPIVLPIPKLIFWGLGIAFFGVFFAVPLRKQVIIREKLKFPSGTATALMISVLHNSEKKPVPSGDEALSEDTVEIRSGSGGWKRQIQLLVHSFVVSGVYTLISYFVPMLRDLPVFGSTAAKTWLWTLNPSPAYVGQGIIMGPETTGHMLLGAILGWAFLSPLAKHQGWAPGPVKDWVTGSRGWLIWLSLSIMLCDSLVSLGGVVLETVTQHLTSNRGSYEAIPEDGLSEDTRLLSSLRIRRQRFRTGPEDNDSPEDDAPPEHLVPMKVVCVGLFLSGILCITATKVAFSQVPLYANIVAFFLALLLSIMGVRALGQTDLNPVSGISKLTQLIFALIVPSSNPAAVAVNLVAGAVSEAGAQQAGDIMQDLKCGHLLSASPRAQFYGQLVGSVFGALISAGVYRVYTAVYPLPGELFQVPTAYVWIDCSRLVYGQGLPPGSWGFAMVFGALFAAATILKMGIGKGNPWIPGGVAVAVGMYNVPSFTLARAVGGFVQWYWSRRYASKEDSTALVIIASGLILGEGVVSLVNLMMASFGVPHF